MKKYICVDIGGTLNKYGILDENFNILSLDIRPSLGSLGVNAMLFNLYMCIDELFDESISGICISSPGVVDINTGLVLYSTPNIKGLSGTNIKEILEEKYKVTVWVENDVNCYGLYENVFGYGKDVSSMLCLTIGTGIGGSFFIDNKIYRGVNFGAMEIGQINFLDDKEICFEKRNSVPSLVRRVRNLDSTITKPEDILNSTNPKVINFLGIYFEEIAKQILNLVNILNPQLVIVVGNITKNDIYLTKVKEKINALANQVILDNLTIMASDDNKYGLIGALIHFKAMDETSK